MPSLRKLTGWREVENGQNYPQTGHLPDSWMRLAMLKLLLLFLRWILKMNFQYQLDGLELPREFLSTVMSPKYNQNIPDEI